MFHFPILLYFLYYLYSPYIFEEASYIFRKITYIFPIFCSKLKFLYRKMSFLKTMKSSYSFSSIGNYSNTIFYFLNWSEKSKFSQIVCYFPTKVLIQNLQNLFSYIFPIFSSIKSGNVSWTPYPIGKVIYLSTDPILKSKTFCPPMGKLLLSSIRIFGSSMAYFPEFWVIF